MTSRILLDRSWAGVVPAGYTVVESEVEFLRLADTPEAKLFVRGDLVCNWAESYFRGRWIACDEVRSPLAILQTVLPHLANDQAEEILRHLGGHVSALSDSTDLGSLLGMLYPCALWRQVPSRQHAAEWLLWLYETGPQDWVRPLLSAMASVWRDVVPVTESLPYVATDKDAALRALDAWLGLTGSTTYAALGVFPLDVPLSLRNRAQNAWQQQIIESKGLFLAELHLQPIPRTLKHLAARETEAYYRAHPADLNDRAVGVLADYLSLREISELRKELAPPAPDALPDTPDAVLQWFREKYLPYRVWQSLRGGSSHLETVEASARDFVQWYLDKYPAGLMDGVLKPFLSFERANRLTRDTGRSAVLLVVLDGLHAADAFYVRMEIEQRIGRLTLAGDPMAFAPLPTITRFCKESLMRGVPPKSATATPFLGMVLPERTSPVGQLSSAHADQLYLWRVSQPDYTYHKKNSYDSLQREVEAQLSSIVTKIGDIADAVPPEVTLQIVITADHGRLLARSHRSIPAPQGMEAHGRAAWGDSRYDFPASGYIIDEGIVHLDSERFGLETNAAIVLGEGAFLASDGGGGDELYPHGGLYPEEVVVPWQVYARDAVAPAVRARAHGTGQAGKRSVLNLYVTNSSEIEITLATLRMTGLRAESEFPVDQRLDRLSSGEFQIPIDRWPSSKESQDTRAVLVVEQPNGLRFDISIEAEIESEEMYQQDDILKGLDLDS